MPTRIRRVNGRLEDKTKWLTDLLDGLPATFVLDLFHSPSLLPLFISSADSFEPP